MFSLKSAFGIVASLTAVFAFGAGSGKASAQSTKSLSRYFPKKVYVALQGIDAVAVLPSMELWTGYPEAHYLSYDRSRKRLVISGNDNGNVYIGNAVSGKRIKTIHVGGLIQGVKVDPNDRYALAVDETDGQIAVINLHTLKIVKKITVGKVPHNVVFTQDGATAYVTIQGEDKVQVIDMKTLAIARTIVVHGMSHPHNLDLTSSGKQLWIRSHGGSQVAGKVVLLDIASGKTLASFSAGYFHGGMDLTPNNQYAITANIGGDTVDLFSTLHPHFFKSIHVGVGPHGVRTSSDGRWIYVGDTGSDELDVISVKTMNVVKRISFPTGSFPFWISAPGNP